MIYPVLLLLLFDRVLIAVYACDHYIIHISSKPLLTKTTSYLRQIAALGFRGVQRADPRRHSPPSDPIPFTRDVQPI